MEKKEHVPKPRGYSYIRDLKERDPEAFIEHQRKAQKASQEKQKLNRRMKEVMLWVLNQKAFPTENEAVHQMMLRYPDLTNRDAMAIALVSKTINDADVKAFIAARDTAGEGPASEIEAGDSGITITVKTVGD